MCKQWKWKGKQLVIQEVVQDPRQKGSLLAGRTSLHKEHPTDTLVLCCKGIFVCHTSTRQQWLFSLLVNILIFFISYSDWNISTWELRATCDQLARKLWLHWLNFNSTNEISSSVKAVLSLKNVCLTKTSICQSVSVFFCLSPTLSLAASPHFGNLSRREAFCSRCRATGGKHVFQISLYVSLRFPPVCFSLPLSDSHHFSHQCTDRKI